MRCRTARRSQAAGGRCGTALPLPVPRTVTHRLSSSGFLCLPLPSPIPEAAPRRPVMRQKPAAGPGRASGSLAPRSDVPGPPAAVPTRSCLGPLPAPARSPRPPAGAPFHVLEAGPGAERNGVEAGNARGGGRHLDGAAGAELQAATKWWTRRTGLSCHRRLTGPWWFPTL